MARDSREDQERSFWMQFGHYSHIAVALPAAIFVGWLLGTLGDHVLHTTWLYLAGVILGVVAGFVELIRTVMASERESEKPH